MVLSDIYSGGTKRLIGGTILILLILQGKCYGGGIIRAVSFNLTEIDLYTSNRVITRERMTKNDPVQPNSTRKPILTP